MERQTQNDIFYSLNIEDIQSVAHQEIGRPLSDTEVESIKELIASKINWYDAITIAIYESIVIEEGS